MINGVIELRHLRTLAAIKRQGGLSEAAARLHMTPSALSHQLLKLESRLGCELFSRRSRPPRFTPAGERLLTLAEAALPLVAEAERDLARLAGENSERLHLAIECHSCYQWLMPVLDRYRQAWPEIALDLSAGFHFEPFPALLRGDLDAVITADRHALSAVHFFPLFRHEVVFAVPATDPLARRPYLTPQDLTERTLVTYPVARERLDVFTQFLDPHGLAPAAVRTAELTAMILQLVASGRGIAMLPRWALDEAPAERVRSVSVGEQKRYATLYLACREDQASRPYMQDFLRLAREVSFDTLSDIEPIYGAKE